MSSIAPTFRIRHGFLGHLRRGLDELHPAYFALSMATGIVAIACHLLGLAELASFLAWTNVVAYPVLWGLLIARACVASRSLLADVTSHQRAPGFFTVVAATSVLGSQLVLLHGGTDLARVLWWVCVGLWTVVTYTVFTVLTVRRQKPTLAEGINGGWLVAVVATQSVCTLGATLGDVGLGNPDITFFVLLCFWLCGGMLYLWIIGLIFQRYMFHAFSPRDLMPPYWVNMGAVAISTLAGTLLLERGADAPLVEPMRPFVLGLTVMFWATATWWIPMLVVLGIWRHVGRGVRVTYDPLYWGLVFPLGMYAVSTFRLAATLDAPFLEWVARGSVIAATSAWLLAFLGLAGRLVHAMLLALRRAPLREFRDAPASEVFTTGGN